MMNLSLRLCLRFSSSTCRSLCFNELLWRPPQTLKQVMRLFVIRNLGLQTERRIEINTQEVKTVERVCNLLRKEVDWDKMSADFASLDLDSFLVEKILLELKGPADAKRALSFFHWSAQYRNLEHDTQSYCVIVQILVQARMLIDARALLESVIRKNAEGGSSEFVIVESFLCMHGSACSSPYLFDFLVQTYVKLRMSKTAFDVCCYLEQHGLSCSLISFNKLLHVSQKSGKNQLVWNIYEHMVVSRTYPNEITVRIMISAMCKEGILQKFVNLLDAIHRKRCTPMVIVNTSLVFKMFEEKRVDKGIMLLKRMLQKNMVLDDIAYSLIIYAHCKTGNLNSVQESYDDMIKRGHHTNPFLYTLFIGNHCKEGRIEEANQLMQEMKREGLKPYDETYNFLVEGCSKVGKLDESLIWYNEMLERVFLPSHVACNEMMRKLCEVGDAKKANNILTNLLDKGFIANEDTYCCLIDGYGKEGNVQEVLKLYYEMGYKGPCPGLMTYTALIRILCKYQKTDEAERYLLIMEKRSLVPTSYSYNVLISRHCKDGNIGRALYFYDEMIRRELIPNSNTFAVLIEKIKDASTVEKTNTVLDSVKTLHVNA